MMPELWGARANAPHPMACQTAVGDPPQLGLLLGLNAAKLASQ